MAEERGDVFFRKRGARGDVDVDYVKGEGGKGDRGDEYVFI